MIRRTLAKVRRHPWRALLVVFASTAIGVNVVAYQHARAMLNYGPAGDRTASPELLSIGQKLTVLVCGVSNPRPANRRTPPEVGLAFETVRIPSTDGIELEAWVMKPASPRGTALLFHGYAVAKSTLLGEAAALVQLGFTTVLVDFRGCGGSTGSSTTLGYREADDVAASVNYIQSLRFPGPVVLYGRSMGAAAVLRSISERGVRADAVILESVFDRMTSAVHNRFELMGVPAFPMCNLLMFWGGLQTGFSADEHNPVEYARNCKCPTLMLHGAQDRSVHDDEVRAVFAALPGSKALEIFPEAGHARLRTADPERWQRVVESHLNNLKGAR